MDVILNGYEVTGALRRNSTHRKIISRCTVPIPGISNETGRAEFSCGQNQVGCTH